MEDTTIIILVAFIGIIGFVVGGRSGKKGVKEVRDEELKANFKDMVDTKNTTIKELKDEIKRLNGIIARNRQTEDEESSVNFDQVLKDPEIQRILQEKKIPVAAISLLDDDTKQIIADALQNPTIREFIFKSNSKSTTESDPVQEILANLKNWA